MASSSSSNQTFKVIICPGNGCVDSKNSNWYGELKIKLENNDISCICENFPDPFEAKREIWY